MRTTLKLFTLLFALSLVSCSKESAIKDAIMQQIKLDAGPMADGLVISDVKMEILDTITNGESLKGIKQYLENDEGASLDQLIARYKDKVEKGQSPGYTSTDLPVYKYKLNKFERIKSEGEDELDYYIVQFEYTVTNKVFNNYKTQVRRYYMINADLDVVGKMDIKSEYSPLSGQIPGYDLFPFEYMMVQFFQKSSTYSK